MVGRGHEMHILAQSFADFDDMPSFHRHQLPGRYTRMRYAAALEDRVTELDLDVVHDTGAGWRCDVFQPHFGSRAALLHRSLDICPWYLRPAKRLAFRVLPRYREFAALEARQYINDGRLFVALSQKVADAFVTYHGVAPDAIRVVHNGVDCEKYSPDNRVVHRASMREELRLEPETVLVLMIAHNFRLKGLGCSDPCTGASALPEPTRSPGGRGRRLTGAIPSACSFSGNRQRRDLSGVSARLDSVPRCRRRLDPSHVLRRLQPRRTGSARLGAARRLHPSDWRGRTDDRRCLRGSSYRTPGKRRRWPPTWAGCSIPPCVRRWGKRPESWHCSILSRATATPWRPFISKRPHVSAAILVLRSPVSPDYSRSATCNAYHVACKQVVFHPLKGTMFCQVDDHAIRKLMDVPPLLQTLGQKHATDE